MFIIILDTIFEEGKANIRGMKLIDFSKLFPCSTTDTLTKKIQPFGTQYQGVIAI